MIDERSASKLYDHFISIYNQVDDFLRHQPGSEDHMEHSLLIQNLARTNRLVARFEHELKALARLRNSLVHSPFMATAHPMATPDRKIISRYDEILDCLLNPPTALSIAVPAGNIFTAKLTDNALAIMKEMNKNVFTHIPVFENNKMIGVFSENTVLSYLAHNGDSIVTNDLTVAEFQEFIELDNHLGEVFEFTHRKADLNEVYDIFNKAIKVRRRVGVLFITEHGKPEEKLLGMLTAWDLAVPERKLT